MIASLYRPLMIGLLPIALMACMSSGPTVADEGTAVPLGVDLGGSGPVTASPQPQVPTRTALAAEGYLDRGEDFPPHRREGEDSIAIGDFTDQVKIEVRVVGLKSHAGFCRFGPCAPRRDQGDLFTGWRDRPRFRHRRSRPPGR